MAIMEIPPLFKGKIPYVEICALTGQAPELRGISHDSNAKPMREFFDPIFPKRVNERAHQRCGDCAKAPFCIRAYSDNLNYCRGVPLQLGGSVRPSIRGKSTAFD